ncbi:MAG: isoprenylcysteine carboxylmethyltransferase family protein [Pyrinomonadaceae bacterium]|nr:isoprenylcysteine carboxylmethyltransferase family protein [Pyrinomonadaceae bacterium]
MRRGGTWIQRWRVPLGFLCAVLFLFLARPRPLSLAIGGAISVLGLAIRAWASGHIRKNDALATSGPYAYSRNPLYFGSFLLGLGFTIGSGWWPLGIVFAALFVGIYLPVMRVESATLAEIFGTDYMRYASNVPLFFPRFTRFGKATQSRKFDSGLYMRYREYRASLGLLVAWAILAFKAYYVK